MIFRAGNEANTPDVIQKAATLLCLTPMLRKCFQPPQLLMIHYERWLESFAKAKRIWLQNKRADDLSSDSSANGYKCLNERAFTSSSGVT